MDFIWARWLSWEVTNAARQQGQWHDKGFLRSCNSLGSTQLGLTSGQDIKVSHFPPPRKSAVKLEHLSTSASTGLDNCRVSAALATKYGDTTSCWCPERHHLFHRLIKPLTQMLNCNHNSDSVDLYHQNTTSILCRELSHGQRLPTIDDDDDDGQRFPKAHLAWD